MKKMIIASTSTIHKSEYLAYLLPTLKTFFTNINELIFVPFARPGGISHDEYTQVAASTFKKININVKGIHEFTNSKNAIENAQAIFVGGGNTFVLVNELYEQNLMDILKQRINNGLPYLGTSAGSNICGPSMQTTNDMPIIYPSSYITLGVIPFNINAHYLDPDPTSTHKGETRETRINEFHTYNKIPVLGLREGSWLRVNGNEIRLEGNLRARLFQQNKSPFELESNALINV